MPPIIKLAKQANKSKEKKDKNHCPYCGYHHCWRHGKYTRKGFHQLSTGQSTMSLAKGKPYNKIVEVLRYLCRDPACEHTFSKLPKDVLPYCRFMLSGLISIEKDLSAGKSAYWIAKHRWGLSLRVILRAVVRLKEITPWLEQLIWETTGKAVQGFHSTVKALRKRFSWFRFTRYLYHRFYPIRVGHILNPHNLGIKRL